MPARFAKKMQYKDLPKDTKKILIDRWWCGHDYCNCNAWRLFAVKDDEITVLLWESSWFNPDDWISLAFPDEIISKEKLELAGELNMALSHYGLKHQVKAEDFWDWETEIELS